MKRKKSRRIATIRKKEPKSNKFLLIPILIVLFSLGIIIIKSMPTGNVISDNSECKDTQIIDSTLSQKTFSAKGYSTPLPSASDAKTKEANDQSAREDAINQCNSISKINFKSQQNNLEKLNKKLCIAKKTNSYFCTYASQGPFEESCKIINCWTEDLPQGRTRTICTAEGKYYFTNQACQPFIRTSPSTSQKISSSSK